MKLPKYDGKDVEEVRGGRGGGRAARAAQHQYVGCLACMLVVPVLHAAPPNSPRPTLTRPGTYLVPACRRKPSLRR